jgi:hypothetical protein
MATRDDSRRRYITMLAIEPKNGTLTCDIQLSFDRMQSVPVSGSPFRSRTVATDRHSRAQKRVIGGRLATCWRSHSR